MELRSARQQENKQVQDLAVEIFKPNMKEQFIRLFHERNNERIMIAKDGDDVVAAVNHYTTHIISNRGLFKVASIGAVCTKNAYRGQGISSRLLALTEDKMLHDHVDFCIISGRRGIYQRFGARDVGAIYRYQFVPQEKLVGDLKPYQGEEHILYDLYQKEPIRYTRDDPSEFHDLFIAQTYPDSYQDYHTYIIEDQGIPKAYVIAIDHHEKNVLQIKEYAGNRAYIASSFKAISERHQKNQIEIMIPKHDTLRQHMPIRGQKMTQQATIKIIDKASFFSKLNQYAQEHHLDVSFEIGETDQVIINHHVYPITHPALLELIFSGTIDRTWASEDKATIRRIVPIGLPWSHNLNYQ